MKILSRRRTPIMVLALICLALSVSACSFRIPGITTPWSRAKAASAKWSKPGAAPEQVAGDTAECTEQAEAILQRDRNIDADIAATRGADWQRGETYTMRTEAAAQSYDDKRRQLIGDCLQKRGYRSSPRD